MPDNQAARCLKAVCLLKAICCAESCRCVCHLSPQTSRMSTVLLRGLTYKLASVHAPQEAQRLQKWAMFEQREAVRLQAKEEKAAAREAAKEVSLSHLCQCVGSLSGGNGLVGSLMHVLLLFCRVYRVS